MRQLQPSGCGRGYLAMGGESECGLLDIDEEELVILCSILNMGDNKKEGVEKQFKTMSLWSFRFNSVCRALSQSHCSWRWSLFLGHS